MAESAEQWALSLGEPFGYAHSALCVPAVRADGSPVVLKVGFPHRESELETDALARWDGRGAVSLLDHDPGSHALLLERCLPGTPLTDAGPEEALEVLAGLVDRLAIPAGPPFQSLAAEAAGWHDRLTANWERAGRPCPWELVEAAMAALVSLAPTQGAQVLVHQDLHSGNVLAAERAPWLAIDPKPLAAELEFAAAPVVRDAALGHRPKLVRHRLDRLVAALGLDAERARGWALAQAVAWGFDGSRPSRANLEVAAWLLADDR
ncbi:MAG: aminoglycoside phosphotransferase family protein [Acidimicrobiales bacterium]